MAKSERLSSPRQKRQRFSSSPSSSSSSPTISKTPTPFLTVPTRYGLSISVTSLDLRMLDCSICNEPLTIPVFQCDNGHTACSSCFINKNKCVHDLSCPFPSIRCWAIEKILESMIVTCENKQYGCTETFSYSKKVEHDQTCSYAPCLCPFLDCNFTGLASKIYSHCSAKHRDSVTLFTYDSTFEVSISSDSYHLILQEEHEDVVFVVQNTRIKFVNVISVSCVAPSSPSEQVYYYHLTAKMNGIEHKFQSFTRNILDPGDDIPLVGLLFGINFFASSEGINLCLCISRNPFSGPLNNI